MAYTLYTLTTLRAGCGPHGWPCAVSHRKVGPPRRAAAYTSLSLKPSWYQHTEASGKQLPDTERCWCSTVAMTQWNHSHFPWHFSNDEDQYQLSCSDSLRLNLRVLAQSLLSRCPRPIYGICGTINYLNLSTVSVSDVRNGSQMRKMRLSTTSHNGSWSQLYKCFGSWFCYSGCQPEVQTVGGIQSSTKLRYFHFIKYI